MRIIVDVKEFVFDDYERDGQKHHYARIKGRTAENEQVTALLWDADAVNLDRALKNLTPDGLEVKDLNLAVQMDGGYKSRTRRGQGGRSWQERVFYVDEGGYQILTGPAAELRAQRVQGAKAFDAASSLAAKGEFEAAFAALAGFVRSFARLDADAEMRLPSVDAAAASADPVDPAKAESGAAVTHELPIAAGEPITSVAEPPASETAEADAHQEATEAAPTPDASAVTTASEVQPATDPTTAPIEVDAGSKFPSPLAAIIVDRAAQAEPPAQSGTEVTEDVITPEVNEAASRTAAPPQIVTQVIRSRRGSMIAAIQSGEALLSDESPETIAAREFGIEPESPPEPALAAPSPVEPSRQPAPEARGGMMGGASRSGMAGSRSSGFPTRLQSPAQSPPRGAAAQAAAAVRPAGQPPRPVFPAPGPRPGGMTGARPTTTAAAAPVRSAVPAPAPDARPAAPPTPSPRPAPPAAPRNSPFGGFGRR